MRANLPSQTAEVVCFMRAAERLVPIEHRVLDDAYAAWFLGALWRARLAGMRVAGGPRVLSTLSNYIVARHRYMDDVVAARLADPAITRLVVLGAGYDMRAWRFADQLGGRPAYEVDHPATSGRKAKIVERHAAQRPAGLDLRRVTIDFQTETLPERLATAGFEPGEPTIFVWEGVSMYLSRAAVKHTLSTLASLGGPGSTLTMDFWQMPDEATLRGAWHRVSGAFLGVFGEPITFGSHPEDVPGLLEREGWEVTDIAGAQQLGERYITDGRPIYPANFVITAGLT